MDTKMNALTQIKRARECLAQMPTITVLPLLVFLMAASGVSAQEYGENIPLGAEIELTNDDIRAYYEIAYRQAREEQQRTGVLNYPGQAESAALHRLIAEINRACDARCVRVELDARGVDVHLANGFVYRAALDLAVVEVTHVPRPLAELREVETDMRDLLFTPAERAGLHGLQTRGQGHLNFGFHEAFADSSERFSRFFADLSNRPELGMGIFGHNELNAPPLSLLSAEQQDELERILAEQREGRYQSATEVAGQIVERVYFATPHNARPAAKYQMIALHSITGIFNRAGDGTIRMHPGHSPAPRENQRVELRFFYGQTSFSDFLLVGELVINYLKFIARQSGPIIYVKSHVRSFTPARLAELYWVFIQELGLGERYERYKPIAAPFLRDLVPNSIFQRSVRWDLQSERADFLWWAEKAIGSQWVRERMIDLMVAPGAVARGMPLLFLERLAEVAEENRLSSSQAFAEILRDTTVRIERALDSEVRGRLRGEMSRRLLNFLPSAGFSGGTCQAAVARAL